MEGAEVAVASKLQTAPLLHSSGVLTPVRETGRGEDDHCRAEWHKVFEPNLNYKPIRFKFIVIHVY